MRNFNVIKTQVCPKLNYIFKSILNKIPLGKERDINAEIKNFTSGGKKMVFNVLTSNENNDNMLAISNI